MAEAMFLYFRARLEFDRPSLLYRKWEYHLHLLLLALSWLLSNTRIVLDLQIDRFSVSCARLFSSFEIMSQLKSQGKWIMNSRQDKDNLPRLMLTLNESLVRLLENARSRDILPTESTLIHAVQSLPAQLPAQGLGLSYTTRHLVQDIAPAVSSSSLSSRYFGFSGW